MSVLQSLSIQTRVVWGLTTYEAMKLTRTSPFGFFSLFVEPLTVIVILSFVLATIRMRLPGYGDYLVMFIMTGVVPVFTFRKAANFGERNCFMSRNLFMFPRVRPLDMMVAGAILGFLAMGALCLAITGIFKFGMNTSDPQNLVLAFVPIVCNAVIGFGFAAINAAISSWWPFWIRVFATITAPLNVLSGLFFTAEMLPDKILEYLYYNPFFHSVDLMRHYYFEEYSSTFFDPYYYYSWVFGALVIGLATERIFRLRIATRLR